MKLIVLKYLFFISFILISNLVILGQNSLSENELLNMAYYSDNSLRTIREDLCNNDNVKIAFSEYFTIDRREMLLLRCTTQCSFLHGHIMGLEDIFLFEKNRGSYSIINKNVGDQLIPIGDDSESRLEIIGKHIYGLITIFQGSGNSHYEKNVEIKRISANDISSLGFISLDYSNEDFYDAGKNINSSECGIKKIESTFTIDSSHARYYDIIVLKKQTFYDQNCKATDSKTEEVIYRFDGDQYIKSFD